MPSHMTQGLLNLPLDIIRTRLKAESPLRAQPQAHTTEAESLTGGWGHQERDLLLEPPNEVKIALSEEEN